MLTFLNLFSAHAFTWFPTGCQFWCRVVERLMHRVKRLKTEDKSEDDKDRYGCGLAESVSNTNVFVLLSSVHFTLALIYDLSVPLAYFFCVNCFLVFYLFFERPACIYFVLNC